MTKIAAKTSKIINKFIAPLSKPQQTNAVAAITAILKQEKPTLYKLNCHKNKKPIQKASHEQNARRMLDNIGIDPYHYATEAISLFNLTAFELVIDRTNWKYGNYSINLLILSAIWNGLSIPIFWLPLDNNGGNSDSLQRIELVQWFITHFESSKIKHIYADREFPAEPFIYWLNENKISFVFRSKSSVLATDGNKKIKLNSLFHNLHNMPNKTKIDKKIRRIYNNRLYLAAKLNERNETIYLISNSSNNDVFQLYRKRWTIESMFAKFKIKGLNLEATHLANSNRVSNLFMLMAISYCYCCKLGYVANNIKPIKLKKLKQTNGFRITPEFSLFNVGFYLLKNFIDNLISGSAVIARQLNQILNSAPNSCIPKHLAIYKIIANF